MDENVPEKNDKTGCKKRRFGKKTAITVTVLLILFASTSVIFFKLNDDSFDFRDREVRTIITNSMDGEKTDYKISTIPKDTLVMVRFLSDNEKNDIQVGDVVQFRYHGILNHHRVISNDTENGFVITKGDNSPTTEKVYYDDVRGEVVGTNHILGEFFIFVKEYVFVILASFVVLYIAILLIEEIRKEKEEKKL